ncbi:fimbria/pilus outer membrane usher protein [Burkholderia cepacia]|uniref:fimbria/pilus outer membrane usher protein n=1 Tax=Burkholderia cepacia TaxID=292 RepID=UPI002ABE1B51|nr:fimbria/pilus outer membrane usher protein [Burkholderia cepacia]
MIVRGRFAIAGIALAKASTAFANDPLSPPGFDADTLKQLGISQHAAEYFNTAPRFLPGQSAVRLKVNGRDIGQVHARFDDSGALCATPELLQAAGLDIPNGASSAPCYDYRVAYPETKITLRPDDNTVEILAPTQALRTSVAPVMHTLSGGTAVLFNYDGLITRTSGNGYSSNYLQLMSEVGANVNDWIVRSKQSFSSSNGQTTWLHQDAYVQRTWASLRSTFQGGQIIPTGSLFSVGQLYGVQLVPEQALYPQLDSGPVISGIATSSSRIEVRQLHSLIYTTQVPAGPFQLHGLQLLNGTDDLSVNVIGTDGRRDAFIVPATSFTRADIGRAQGLSIAAGLYDDGTDSAHPPIVTATNGWSLGHRANVSVGFLASAPYQAVAANLNGLIGPAAQAMFQWTGAAASTTSGQRSIRVFGQQATLTLSAQPLKAINLSASGAWRSGSYRDLGSVVQRGDSVDAYSQQQYSASIGWSSNVAGNLSASYFTGRSSGSGTSSRAMLTWSRQFDRASLSVSASTGIGGNSAQRARAIYLTVSVPFERRSISTSLNLSGKSMQYGAAYSDQVSPTLSYTLGGSQSGTGGAGNINGSLSATPRYTQVSASASISQAGSRSLSFGLHGGIAAYRGGAVFSPYTIGDTFGIVQLNGVSGIKLNTPSGSVWSDFWGKAIVPSMPPYTTSEITIDTRSLPRNVDVQNGIQSVDLARGAVTQLNFPVRKTRRLLLSTTLPDGSPIPARRAVTDAAGHFVTISGDDGHIFLDDVPSTPLSLQLPDGKACHLDFTLTKAQNISRFYESVKAACRPYDPNSTPSPIAPPGAHEDR